MFHVNMIFSPQVYTFSMKAEKKALPVFSRNLRRIRKTKGLSQYDLADKTGLSQRMIYHYENHVSEPPLSKIAIIAKALDVAVADLLEDPAAETALNASHFDTRSLKKLQDILSLPPNDRAIIYRMLNKLIRENKRQSVQAQHVAESTRTE
jgi:transcriptional regulator with XRE-family HTH domain